MFGFVVPKWNHQNILSNMVFWSKKAFACAKVILCSLVTWFSRKFRNWMVLFWSLLDQFVSSFDRANGLSIFQFDAVRYIDFSAKGFDQWVQWIRDSCFVFNFWKSKIKIYVEVDAIIVSILSFETSCSIFACLMIAPTILLFFRDFLWNQVC